MKSGIINVYKEAGYTSFDVVAKMRGILGIKKIGHTGTLDPDATGVLPVCIGKATKVCDLLTDKDKTYEAVMRLGIVTDTQDMTGQVLEEHAVTVTEDEVRQAVGQFVGQIEQIPPMYSALKVGGQKLCDLARKGIEVERKPRPVTIYEIRIKNMALPLVTMEVHCSKGTYIRTLCQDIGHALGCGGCMESLVRTQVASFALADSLTLAQIEEAKKADRLEQILLPIDQVFSTYPKVYASEEEDKRLVNGNAIDQMQARTDEALGEGDPVRMYLSDGRFVGIYYLNEHQFKLKKMFLEMT